MSSDDSDSSGGKAPKKKLMKVSCKTKQVYRKCWEEEEEFKGWLEEGRHKFEATCILCNSFFTSQLHVIKNHSKSAGHIKNKTTRLKNAGISQYFKPNSQPTQLDEDIKKAEIKLCAFLTEHNVAFLATDHLTSILQECFPDSKIAQKLKLGRTKTTAIVKNVLGKTQKETLVAKIQNSKFSIMTDESTDISSEKNACIVIRYYDSDQKKIVSNLWELAQVFSNQETINNGATAQNLFVAIRDSFHKFDVPYDNIVGFGSDGCNVMMGAHNSVASRFQELCPGIAIMKCVCHSAHLIASEACKSLPRRCEDLARNIFNFINGSTKRICSLKQFQQFLNIDVHKILQPSQTRWLSLHAVVCRILEQWEPLRLFFNEQWLSERLVAAETIFKDLNDSFIKLYYYFLEYVLPKFTIFNQYFQSENVIVAELYEKMCELYKEFLLMYLNRNYVLQNSIDIIDPSNSDAFLNKTNIYMGIKIMQEKEKPCIRNSPKNLDEFYSHCQTFLVKTCVEIKKRFNFNDRKLQQLTILKPENAMSNETLDTAPSLFPLFESFPRIIAVENVPLKQKIDDQWRKLSTIELPQEIKTEKLIDVFWGKLMDYKNILGDCEFKELAQFVLEVLLVPHSNAQCERIFSKVNLVKTKLRNKLHTETLNGILLASELIKNNGGCTRIKVDKKMCNKINQTMYDFKNQEEEDNTILIYND